MHRRRILPRNLYTSWDRMSQNTFDIRAIDSQQDGHMAHNFERCHSRLQIVNLHSQRIRGKAILACFMVGLFWTKATSECMNYLSILPGFTGLPGHDSARQFWLDLAKEWPRVGTLYKDSQVLSTGLIFLNNVCPTTNKDTQTALTRSERDTAQPRHHVISILHNRHVYLRKLERKSLPIHLVDIIG